MTTVFSSKLKRSTFDAFMDCYGRVGVVVEVGGGAILPERYADAGGFLLLDFWPGAPTPITDLTVDDEAVMATLSFEKTPFQCVVPWVQVRAVQSPNEQLALVHPKVEEIDPPATPPAKKGFRVIEGGA